jgi:TRAP-type mannitol/chloroaromatic compound transport system substrate-binding protein
MLHAIVNLQKWQELPKSYQALLTAAGAFANDQMMARYDVLNPKALRELVAGGAKLRPFPQDVMEACFKAAGETYTELSASNGNFKKVFESMAAFRREGYLWWQLSEYGYDAFMMGEQRKKAL